MSDTATVAASPAAQTPTVSYPIPPQAVPLAVDLTVQAQLNPPMASGGVKKEVREATAAPAVSELTTTPETTPESTPTAETIVSLEGPQVEQAAGLQVVEKERVPEVPPEIEAYLQRVEDHQDQLPKEVVVADGSTPHAAAAYMAQPVIVLPITPQVQKTGAKKSPNWSVRWLVEFSHKIMKMFFGKVVYKEAEVGT